MEIGEPKRVREVEPVEAPIPEALPVPGPEKVPATEPAPAVPVGSDDDRVTDAWR
jgi:hypothetical protein